MVDVVDGDVLDGTCKTLRQRGRMKTEQTDIFSSSPAPAGRREDGMSNPLELVKSRLEVAGQKLSNH